MDERLSLSFKFDREFDRARRRALDNRIVAWLRRKPTELLPLSEVQSRLNIRGRYDRGLQVVPLAKIVGSQGRTGDFDRHFLPRSERTKDRWNRVNHAYRREMGLPPVELYKLDDIYFVSDGHHRVSVARHRGQLAIEAHVIEFELDVRLSPDVDIADLSAKEEQSDFFEWTNLAQLRPGSVIEVSTLGGYLDLIRHINRHRTQLDLERGGQVSPQEAITGWYDTNYEPIVNIIRRMDLLRLVPRTTKADLFIDIANYVERLREHEGRIIGTEAAVLEYLVRFGPYKARRHLRRHFSPPVRLDAPSPGTQRYLLGALGLRSGVRRVFVALQRVIRSMIS